MVIFIALSDAPEVVKKKVFSMYTDPNRTSADVPGKGGREFLSLFIMIYLMIMLKR